MIPAINVENIRKMSADDRKAFLKAFTEEASHAEVSLSSLIERVAFIDECLAAHAAEGIASSRGNPARTAREWDGTRKFFNGEKIPVEYIHNGIDTLEKVTGLNARDMGARFSVTDPHAVGFFPQKSLNKVACFFAVVSGAHEGDFKIPRQDRLMDAHLENACRAFVNEWILSRGKRDAQGRFVKRSIELGIAAYREKFGYKSMLDSQATWKIDAELSARIDAAITEGAASYGTSTINSQSGQIKSLMLALGLALVRLPDGREVSRAYGEDGQTLVLTRGFSELLFEIDRTTHPFIARDVTRNARS